MAERQVGTFRSARARGASVRMPPQNNERRLALVGRFMLAAFGLGLVALAGVGIKQAVEKVNAQKITEVAIEGDLNFASDDDIKESVKRFVATSLVSIDMDVLKRELEDQPWISDVAIRREWPGRLIIHVNEEVAIARWGDDALVNQQGHIFKPDDISALMQLPLLSGPKGEAKEVMQQYLEFNQLLYPLGVRIRDLTMNARGAWTMTLTNGIVVRLGREQELARLRRLITFLQVMGAERLNGVTALDLRYRNGIAVEHAGTPGTPKDGALVARSR
jgi:cell division protein FtsQ